MKKPQLTQIILDSAQSDKTPSVIRDFPREKLFSLLGTIYQAHQDLDSLNESLELLTDELEDLCGVVRHGKSQRNRRAKQLRRLKQKKRSRA